MDELLQNSFELHSEIINLFGNLKVDETPNKIATEIMCSIAFEHAHAVKVLVETGHVTSAIGVKRLQLEALVRAFWCYYAATETGIEKFFTELTEENAGKLNKVPSIPEMIRKIGGKAPEAVVSQLKEIENQSYKQLCSFVHSGVLAFQAHAVGIPEELLKTLVKGSNALAMMTATHLMEISENAQAFSHIQQLYFRYADYLPIPEHSTPA